VPACFVPWQARGSISSSGRALATFAKTDRKLSRFRRRVALHTEQQALECRSLRLIMDLLKWHSACCFALGKS